MTIDVDTTNLSLAFQDLRAAFIGQGQPGDAATILQDETRLLEKQIIKFLPPKNLAQGRKATSADNTRAASPLDPDTFLNDEISGAIKKMVAKGDEAGLTKLYNRFPTFKGWQAKRFSKQLHRSAQNQRGRVPQSKRIKSFNVKEARKYRSNRMANVGTMKATFGRSYVELGGKLPGWINKKIPDARRYSFFVNDLRNSSPSLTVGSSAKGIGEFRRAIREAVRAREQAILKRVKIIASGYAKDVAQGIRIKNRARLTPDGGIA